MSAQHVRAPFSYYGGKSNHLGFILPNLPENFRHYAEPFGGSASVLLARPPADIETYNDIHSDFSNFFSILRDHPGELERLITLTPYHQDEFDLYARDEEISDMECARRFFFRMASAYSGRLRDGGFAVSRTDSRRGMSDRVARYITYADRLSDIAERILRVQFTSMDAVEFIRRFDSPETLFYCDPPYAHGSRVQRYCYTHEMSDADHRCLANVLYDVEGLVAISGYRCQLYDELFGGWNRTDGPINRRSENKRERQEVLWTNYDPETVNRKTTTSRIRQKTLLEV